MANSVYYRKNGFELEVFEAARKEGLPLLLKGPTGCGKSRFVEYVAQINNLELISVACNEDTSAADLVGRHLLRGQETYWQDGPVTRAVRNGALLYLDEIAEAREDVMVVLHSLTDHRRELFIDKTNEKLVAHKNFILMASFNPGYQSRLKEMKPSTRQRFVTLSFQSATPSAEVEILVAETKIEQSKAEALVKMATRIRALKEYALRETVSTRNLVLAAHMIREGLHPRLAAQHAVVETLTDDADVTQALLDVVSLSL